MTDLQATEYPAWQEQIRWAQADIRAEIEAERVKSLEAQAARDLRLGGLLEAALGCFGIDTPTSPLVTNEVQRDGIRFTLSRYSRDDDGQPTLIGQDLRREPIFSFDLEVSYALSGKYAAEQENHEDYSTFKALAIRHAHEDMDWSQECAQLADAIDTVTGNAKAFMAKVDSWDTQPVTPPLPTLSQQLESLLREIVRDELMKQDYGYEVE